MQKIYSTYKLKNENQELKKFLMIDLKSISFDI